MNQTKPHLGCTAQLYDIKSALELYQMVFSGRLTQRHRIYVMTFKEIVGGFKLQVQQS